MHITDVGLVYHTSVYEQILASFASPFRDDETIYFSEHSTACVRHTRTLTTIYVVLFTRHHAGNPFAKYIDYLTF